MPLFFRFCTQNRSQNVLNDAGQRSPRFYPPLVCSGGVKIQAGALVRSFPLLAAADVCFFYFFIRSSYLCCGKSYAPAARTSLCFFKCSKQTCPHGVYRDFLCRGPRNVLLWMPLSKAVNWSWLDHSACLRGRDFMTRARSCRPSCAA